MNPIQITISLLYMFQNKIYLNNLNLNKCFPIHNNYSHLKNNWKLSFKMNNKIKIYKIILSNSNKNKISNSNSLKEINLKLKLKIKDI